MLWYSQAFTALECMPGVDSPSGMTERLVRVGSNEFRNRNTKSAGDDFWGVAILYDVLLLLNRRCWREHNQRRWWRKSRLDNRRYRRWQWRDNRRCRRNRGVLELNSRIDNRRIRRLVTTPAA
jgi:hypothetical protein